MKDEKETLLNVLLSGDEEKIKEYVESNGKQKMIIPFRFEEPDQNGNKLL